MSLIRKVIWPAAIALGFLMFLGAIGQSNVVKTAQAFDGDICAIMGPTVIAPGETALYIAVIEDDDEGDEYVVQINDIVGNSDITSLINEDEEADIDDYEKISPTDQVEHLDTIHIDDVDDDLLPWLIGEFPRTFPGGIFDASQCGTDVSGAVAECIDDGDCTALEVSTTTGITAAIRNAAIAAVEAALNQGIFNCDDLDDIFETSLITGGVNEGPAGDAAAEFNDICEHNMEDDAVFNEDIVIVDVTCTIAGNFQISFSSHFEADDTMSLQVVCQAPATALTISPATVEIVPALGSQSWSLITTTAAPGTEVHFETDRCSIETSSVDTAAELAVITGGGAAASTAALATAVDSTPKVDSTIAFLPTATSTTGTAAALLLCGTAQAPGTTPGVANILVTIAQTGVDVIIRGTVTVVGPPAFITATASPTSVRCDQGEKAQITAKVTDAIGQPVSPHTLVEAVTNFGGVLGGTGLLSGGLGGSILGQVAPLSSTIAETDANGNATFFLITSQTHTGNYDVLVTSGGGGAVAGAILPGGGIFSTLPVSTQVTVTCIQPAPAAQPTAAVTAPRTGTGVQPPSTGEAGLADTSNGSGMVLFLIGGAVALTLAGLATVRFARR